MNLPVSFYGQDVSGEGTLLSISMGGCSFRTDTKLESGAMLNLKLQIANDVSPVVVDAVAVRHVRQRCVGVEFLLWQQSEQARLQLFVRGLLIGRGVDLEPLSAQSETLLPR